jgi:hypothetical protein
MFTIQFPMGIGHRAYGDSRLFQAERFLIATNTVVGGPTDWSGRQSRAEVARVQVDDPRRQYTIKASLVPMGR